MKYLIGIDLQPLCSSLCCATREAHRLQQGALVSQSEKMHRLQQKKKNTFKKYIKKSLLFNKLSHFSRVRLCATP